MGNRSNDIRDKLAYARSRYLGLRDELSKAEAFDAQVSFVGHTVGEILSACCESFDYAAKDIADAYVPLKPKERIYFPFSVAKLATSNPFQRLSTSHPAVFAVFQKLADRMDANVTLNMMRQGIVAEANDLVNQKKHDKIIIARRRENAATRSDFGEGGSVTMSGWYSWDKGYVDFSEEPDPMPMVGSHPDIKIRFVPEYRLAANNWEISEYCSQVIEVSWRLLDEIYDAANLGSSATFNPRMTLRSPEQVAHDELLARADHIVWRLIGIEFLNGGKVVKALSLDFDGNDTLGNEDDRFLAEQCRCAFTRRVGPRYYARAHAGLLRERLAEIEQSGFKPMKWTLPLTQSATVKLPSGSELSYDSFTWTVGIKFQQPKPRHAPIHLSYDADACLRLLFPPR